MNQIAWQIFGGTKAKANTFIGGVASTITTAGALATRLEITSNRITNFKIVGSDIECRISGSYSIPAGCFQNDTLITYYRDVENLVSSLQGNTFAYTTQIKRIEFNGVLSISESEILGSNIEEVLLKNCISSARQSLQVASKLNIVYIPNCTILGDSPSVNNDVFFSIKVGCKIYAHPSMATINAGGVEADLAAAISAGAIVRYVTNFTAPNTITNLSVGNVYGTAIQLNFTAPTGSTNAIEFYEIYVNGVYNRTVTASGGYASGLTFNTAYTIEVKPVDIFYNKSTSNVVSVTTMASELYPVSNIVSYYKMENNVLDSFGANNGTATAITYASGLVGQTAVFNGSISVITVPDNDTLTFANATNDLPFSIGYSIKTSDTQFYILSKTSATLREYECQYAGGQLGFRLVSNGNAGNRLDQNYTIPMAGAWINVIHTYNGLGNGGMKTYVNGVLAISTNTLTGTYVKMQNTINPLLIGNLTAFATYELNGQLDEVSIFNTALTAGEVSEINAKLNTGQSLI